MRQDPRMLKPFTRLGRPNMKGFNTTEIRVRSKVGANCIDPAICKSTINWRRINAETNRRNYAIALFVPVPLLVKNDGKRTIPQSLRTR